jgi:hypothetical protein
MKHAGILLIGLLLVSGACRSKHKIIVEKVQLSDEKVDTPPPPGPIEKHLDSARPKPPTHLHDTTRVSGNFILFLRPDDKRFEAETADDAENGMMEGDADFGVGISGTQDSVKGNQKYKGIRVVLSTNRYIQILDCKGGPLTIDRDTVNYGYILSGAGMAVLTTYNEVHSGNYLQELDEYFALR